MLHLTLRAIAPLALAGTLFAQVGSVIGTIDSPSGAVPVGLGVDASGNLYVTATGGTVYKLDRSGNVLQQWSVATNSGIPNGITTDGTNFFITDGSTLTGGRGVDVYDAQFNYVRTFAVSALFPAGIAWRSQNGSLYVVDRIASNGIVEYDTQGNQLATHSLNGSANDGIAHDAASDTFWVNETAGDLLRQYDNTFTELQNFPGVGAAIGSNARGAALYGGILYVVAQAARKIVMFDTTGNLASVGTYGRGCPREPVVYELFPQATLDIANSAFLFSPNGQGGWSVSQCVQNCFDSTLGTNLNLGDDQLAVNQQLGFSFPMLGSPNGSTNAIDVSSNGFVFLRSGASASHGCCNGDPATFVAGPEMIAALWMDLDPGTRGGVYFRSDATKAVITWFGVPEIGVFTPTNTAQIQLLPNGSFILSYQNVSAASHTVLIGYSSGDDSYDPGSTDLSASIPFSTGIGAPRLRLDSDRPVLGSTVTYAVTQLPPNAALGSIIFGSQQNSLVLDPIGMTGCTLLTTGDLAAAPLAFPAGTFQLGIPSSQSLIGATIHHQGVVIAPGLNPFGVITSNGLTFRLGL